MEFTSRLKREIADPEKRMSYSFEGGDSDLFNADAFDRLMKSNQQDGY